MNGVFAVFVAAVAFDRVVGGSARAKEHKVQESVNQFFSIPIFVLFDLLAPVGEWLALGWTGLLLVLAILVLRRLPWVFALVALRYTQEPAVWLMGSLVVCASIVLHGMTAIPFVKWYCRQPQ